MLRWIGRGLAGLLAVAATALGLVVLVLGVALALAQTEFGQRRIAALVESRLGGPDGRAEVRGLGGAPPFDIRLDHLALADADGVWLELDDARLAWSPRALLRGLLLVEEISAARIDVRRLPGAGDEPEPEEQDEPFRLPELPETVPPVIVERIAVERIELGEPVLGEAAAFALHGRMAAADDGSAVEAGLNLERLDEATARATLDAVLALGPPVLTLSVAAEETGGLLAGLTGRPEAGAFRLALDGSGPLVDWEGRLEVVAENLARLGADVGLSIAGEPTLALDARLVPEGGLVPAGFAPLLGDALGLAVTVTRTEDQRLLVEDLRLTTAALTVEGWARLDPESQRVEAEATARADDLAPIGNAFGTPLAGSLALRLTAEGAVTQPEVELAATVTDLAAPSVVADRATASARLTPLDPEAPGYTGIRAVGGGAFEGLALTEGPALPDDELRWDLAAVVPADGPVEVERLEVGAAPVDLVATATVDPATSAGEARIELAAADLAPLVAALAPDQRIEGAAELTADVALAEGGERVAVALAGRLSGLGGDLPPGAAELLGRDVTLAADAEVLPGVALEVADLVVEGAAAQLRGGVALGLVGDDRPLDGRLTLSLPRLAALEPVVEQPVAGEAVAVLGLGGTLAAPEVRLDAAADDVVFADQSLDSLTVELSALGLPEAPRGDIALTAARGEQTLSASTSYRLDDQTLVLADLTVSAPATELDGELAVHLEDGPLVDGRLSGTVGDLAALTALVGGGFDLAGRVELAADLRAADGRQNATLTAEAADLAGAFGRIDALDLRAEATDVLDRLRLEGRAELTGFRSDGTALERASAMVAGNLAGLDVTAEVVGEQQAVAFDLGTAARVDLADAGTTVRLDRLDGTVAEQPVGLARPATLAVAGEAATVQDLELRLASARLRADGRYGPDGVRLEAQLEALPLDLLAAFGAPELAGTAAATLEVAGPLANPRAALTANAQGLRLADPEFANLPPAALSVSAELAERRLDATLRAERLTEGPITARLGAPVVLTLEPFAFELPEEGRLSGGLQARARLERLSDYFFPLDGQEIAGLLRADLALAGTVGSPAIEGELALTDGRYENGTTGTVLRNITLRATGSERRIVVRELNATDGGRGRIRGEGAISLVPEDAFPFELELRLDRATLVRRDIAEATASGGLQLRGDIEEALIGGRLTVNRLEVSLRDLPGGGVDIVALDVVEIGENGAPAAGPEAVDGGGGVDDGPAPTVALDVRIEIPGRAFIRGRGLQSEWQGQLRVQGTVEEPQILGTLSVRRGELEFLDRTFQLREGAVQFTGASPPVPELDFAAVAEAEGFTAVVRVTGPATDPKIELTSEPPLPEDEILSRLLFNRSADGLSAGQAVSLAAAVNRLRGGAGPDLLGGVRDFLGVDALSLGAAQTAEGETSPTVEVGKYLTDDVYLGLEKGAGQGTGRATVEVEILPNVTLEAEVSEDARTGVGVQWKFDY